jgi:hypothetical protein
MILVEDGFPESCQLDLLSAGGERGGCSATMGALPPWVDSDGGNVSLLDVFNL